MNEYLIPLYIFGTLLIFGLGIAVAFSLVIQKQRQVKNRLAHQKQAFEYNQALLNTRVDVQESTLNMIAQELHDNVAQSLTACFMQVSTGAALCDQNSAAKQIIDEAKHNINQIVQTVRMLGHSLATGMVERRELREAIQAELTRIESVSHISCALRSDTIQELQPDQRLLLFRVFQESLQNILKHANARNIWVELESDRKFYSMSIKDDGDGFDIAKLSSINSFGLMNIKERIGLLNGTLNISSAPKEGTQIVVTIPIVLQNGKDKNSHS